MDSKINKQDDLNLKDLIDAILKYKYKIMFSTFIVTSLTTIYLLYLPNTYKSEATLASANVSSSTLSQMSSSFGGVASLAGISIPSGETNKIDEALEILKSLNFFSVLSKEGDTFFVLQATKGWNSNSNELIIDENVYDIKNQKWVSDEEFNVNGRPSLQSAHIDFLDSLSITTDKKTGFVKISIEHFSPYVAKNILESIIYNINNKIRTKDIQIANESLKFLNNQIEQTKLAELRSNISNLIEKQIQTITFAQSSDEYIFKILSEPSAPERKSGPKRLSSLISAVFLTFFLSTIFYISKYLFFNKDNE